MIYMPEMQTSAENFLEVVEEGNLHRAGPDRLGRSDPARRVTTRRFHIFPSSRRVWPAPWVAAGFRLRTLVPDQARA
jgi:hypothetical protein